MTFATQLGLDGFALRDAAMERVEAAAGDDWNGRALAAVRLVCRTQTTFSTNAVWATGLEKPQEPRAMGPVMMRARIAGYCTPLDHTEPSEAPSQHGQPLRVYQSLLLRQESVAP